MNGLRALSRLVALGSARAGAPAWLKAIDPAALSGIDFVNNRSFGMGYDFANTSGGYGLTAAGVYVPFAANVLRRTDRGAIIEPTRTNLVLRSGDLTGVNWTRTNVTASLVSGITQLLETVTSNVDHRVIPNALTIVNGTTYTFWAEVQKRGRRYVYLRASPDGVNPRNAGFDLDTGTVLYQGAGVTARIVAVGSRYRLEYSFVAGATSLSPSIGISSVAVMSDALPTVVGAGDIAQGLDVGPVVQTEAGASASSRIDTGTGPTPVTRAADDLDLKNFSGTKLRFTFDDNSTQEVAAISAPYQVPTNLNRSLIKSVISLAA